MKKASENLIVELTFRFALEIIEFAEELEAKRKFVLANQILKAGCSIGANVKESQGAESRPDFIHKMKIAFKEAEETEYWLLLCKFSKSYPFQEKLLEGLYSILKVLSKIISSAKEKLNAPSANQQIKKSAN